MNPAVNPALAIAFAAVALLTGCNNFNGGGLLTSSGFVSSIGPQSNPVGSRKITLSWAANHETAVNSSGGGYRVYYFVKSQIDGNTPYVDVPYVSGPSAPTTVEIGGLGKATYFVNVVAYSALNPTGSAATQKIVVVP